MPANILKALATGCYGISQTAVPVASESEAVAIYDSISSNISETYFISKHQMALSSKAQGGIGAYGGEFSGPYRDCSDQQLLCASGAINIVLPRVWIINRRTKVKYEHNYCVVLAQNDSNVLTGNCINNHSRDKINFRYDRRRGLISYSRLSKRDRESFVLRGQCGIFAASGCGAG